MKLKLSFWNQVKMLMGLIFMSLVYFSFLYFGWNSFDLKLMFFLLIPYFVLFFIPVMCIHFNYLNENQGVFFEISKDMIFVNTNAQVLKYTSEDIGEIVFYMSGTRNRGNGGLAHSGYYYARVNLLDGSSFIITSLYSSKIDKIIEENFKDVKMITEKVFYPMIS